MSLEGLEFLGSKDVAREIEMRNLTSFQMEKLCYDLRLEVLKEMDPGDTIELVKVNAEFQSMLSRKPWLVLDRHVHQISLSNTSSSLSKFPRLRSYVRLDDEHLPLTKRIQSCNELDIRVSQLEPKPEFSHGMLVNQLSSVRHLTILEDFRGHHAEFIKNFRGMVKESVLAEWQINWKDPVISELWENFIVNQANECEEFYFYGNSAEFHVYYEAFAKTSIKFLRMASYSDGFVEIVQSIVKKQIPSRNLKALFYLHTNCQKAYAPLVDFISQFPGMKQFDGESQAEVKMVTEDLKKRIEEEERCWPEESKTDLTNLLFFRQNIDSSMDCVYLLIPQFYSESDQYLRFFAFYVEPQS